MNKDFWNKKKIFITGHTGFKGSWLSLWLKKLGAEVKGFSLEPNTNPSLFKILELDKDIDHTIGDIRDLDYLKQSLQDFSPELLIHMAAQPLVRKSYVDPIDTYSTNVIGTVNVLEASREVSTLKAILNVTTDKCYENKEWIWGYREEEPLGGYDPYSSSKACSEIVTSAYRRSFFNNKSKASVASARAGNVIGGGDWSSDRLVVDALKAFENNRKLLVRNPSATRPWQHVLEPLSGYLTLLENLYQSDGSKFAEAWNFGPKSNDTRTVSEVLNFLTTNWPSKAIWEDSKTEEVHEAQLLKLDISKARDRLDWEPKWNLDETLLSIIDWQSKFLAGQNMREVTLEQIKKFELS